MTRIGEIPMYCNDCKEFMVPRPGGSWGCPMCGAVLDRTRVYGTPKESK